MIQNNKIKWFQVLAMIVGIYHSLLGLIGLLAPANFVVAVASKVYGLTIVAGAQFIVTARFASAYMLALGIMAIFMARKPREYAVFIWPIVIMIAARILTRLFYAEDIYRAFGAGWAENIRMIAVVALIAIGLLSLRPKNESR
ncbi:MAG: hypothetical protein Q8R08_03705 [bacterium]|nr:hypothetical protein [bacterium]